MILAKLFSFFFFCIRRLITVRGQRSEVGGGVKFVLVSVIVSGDGARFSSTMGKNQLPG